jgi:hypothetical protein
MNVTVLKMHSAGTMELITQKIQLINLYTPLVWYVEVGTAICKVVHTDISVTPVGYIKCVDSF